MHMKHTNQKDCFGSFKASCSYPKLIQTKPNGNNMLPCIVSGNMEGGSNSQVQNYSKYPNRLQT